MEIEKLILFILCIIAVIVAIIMLANALGEWGVPPAIGYGDKSRFLDYLGCSYAMCARGCGSEPVRNIELEDDLNCNDMCLSMGSPGEHLCGRPYSLQFTFNGLVKYLGNYKVTKSVGIIVETKRYSMQTDVMRYKNWQKKILGDSSGCFNLAVKNLKLDGFEPNLGISSGCKYSSSYIEGTCEGILRSSTGCQHGSTQLGSPPNDFSVGTGHIWIDPVLTGACEPFLVEELGSSTGTKYYGNCTFGSGVTVYIWAEESGIPGFYCPELVICDNP